MDDNLKIYKFDCFDVKQDIIVAVTPLLTENELKDQWIHYRDELIEVQDTEISDFSRWNFYLFYVVKDKKSINRSLKYEIEHNTISSRKIVVNIDELGEKAETLIEKYIKYAIESKKEIKSLPSFQSNQKLNDLYKQHEDQED